ncbi:MAG: nucleotide exchange factor GrpE [Peptococcaceae bacterium]|nr:nucleotide exchange factor GrpE [Peptococcaceae bacterium]
MSENEQSKDTASEEPKVEDQAQTPETPETEEKDGAPAADDAYEALNKRYLRLLADFDNFKRRNANEKDEIYKYGAMNLIKDLLPILDSFELALKNTPEDADESVLAYQDGFEKVQRQLLDGLGKAGLERIEAVGQEYDPHFHEAIMVVDDAEKPANTVIDELRAGYKFKDKVLRPTVCRVTGNK